MKVTTADKVRPGLYDYMGVGNITWPRPSSTHKVLVEHSTNKVWWHDIKTKREWAAFASPDEIFVGAKSRCPLLLLEKS